MTVRAWSTRSSSPSIVRRLPRRWIAQCRRSRSDSSTPSPMPASSTATSLGTDKVSCTPPSVGWIDARSAPLAGRGGDRARLCRRGGTALPSRARAGTGARLERRPFRRIAAGGGRRGAHRARRARGSVGCRNSVVRPTLFPLRHRRDDPGRAGRRLAHVAVGSERVLGRQLAVRGATRGGCRPLAPRAVRAARGLGRRAHDRCDDGELRRPGMRAALVGGAARGRPRRARLRRVAGGARLLHRVRPRERAQGARDAGTRPRFGAGGRCRRLGARAGCARQCSRDRHRQRRGREHRRLRSDRADGRSRRQARGLAPRRWCLRALRARDAEGSGAGRRRRQGRFGDADGHKWLNVPYDCGFAFIRDRELLREPFRLTAAYLPTDETPSPEASRRARSLAVWATLRAYGRAGYRAMVERHLELAQRLSRRVDETPELERLAETRLNIVCFRFRPPGLDERELDELNLALGQDVLEDGRVFVGTTVYHGKVAFRPAIVNWRTTERDVDLLIDVLLELASQRLPVRA